PELLRVKRPPVSRRAPRPRAAVHDQRWHAIGVPTGLPVHEVPVTGIQQAGLIGLDIRIPRHAKDLMARSVRIRAPSGSRRRRGWRGTRIGYEQKPPGRPATGSGVTAAARTTAARWPR